MKITFLVFSTGLLISCGGGGGGASLLPDTMQTVDEPEIVRPLIRRYDTYLAALEPREYPDEPDRKEVANDLNRWGIWMTHSAYGLVDEYLGIENNAVAYGVESGTIPDVPDGTTLRWEGHSFAYHVGSGVQHRGRAFISAELDAQNNVLVDVNLTGVRAGGNFDWQDIVAEDGYFTRDEEGGSGDFIYGVWFGLNHEEVAGVFQREGYVGAFGGK